MSRHSSYIEWHDGKNGGCGMSMWTNPKRATSSGPIPELVITDETKEEIRKICEEFEDEIASPSHCLHRYCSSLCGLDPLGHCVSGISCPCPQCSPTC